MFRKAKSLGKSLLIASGAIVFSVGIYAVTAEFIGPGLKVSTDNDRPLGTTVNLLVGTNADQIEISNDCSGSTAEICLDADDGYDMDSSNVVANASWSVIERLEWLIENKVDDKNCQAGGITSGTNDFDSDAVTYDIDYTLTGVTQTGSYVNDLTYGQETYTATLSCEQTVVTVSNESVAISCDGGYHEEGGDCVIDWVCGMPTDYEGQSYNTVAIGTQCWMAENLNVGSKLASGATNPTDNSTVEKWCYGNNDANCDTYGGLYNWDEMMGYTTTEGGQGICPTNWHVATDSEWYALESYYATGTCDANRSGAWDCNPAGTALKSGGASGFETLLAGRRTTDSSFFHQGDVAYFWSSTESSVIASWYRYLDTSSNAIRRSNGDKGFGFSVRCLSDIAIPDITPATFSFSDQNGVELATVIESDIIQITGIDTPSAVNVSDDGNPQFRICSDADCTTEVQTWGNAEKTITNNQYLQLRLTSGAVAGTEFTATVTVGEVASSWLVTDNALPVEDVFSTYLYEGNASTQTIENGIDLENNEWLIWIKNRSYVGISDHWLQDTVKGATKKLLTNSIAAEYTNALSTVSSFNNNGFGIQGNAADINITGHDFVSWTFRQAPRFFDIVTYTGDGVAGREIAHELGVEPGMIVVKRTDSTGYWQTYHISKGSGYYMWLNDETAGGEWSGAWNDTTPTSATFVVGNHQDANENGAEYVAYLFAHDESEDGKIQCGDFTTDGSGHASVDLGWEPQWSMIKRVSDVGAWDILDTMRGFTINSGTVDQALLQANSSNAEATNKGFGLLNNGFNYMGYQSSEFIYCAIRKAPMKEPISGEEVYDNLLYNTTSVNEPRVIGSDSITPDLLFTKYRNNEIGNSNFTSHNFYDRVRGSNEVLRSAYDYEEKTTNGCSFDTQAGFRIDWYGNSYTSVQFDGYPLVAHFLRRAPGFLDIVAYTGDGVAGKEVKHNLGVEPEMIIAKSRATPDQGGIDGYWLVYHKDNSNNQSLFLNTSDSKMGDASWYNTTPTASNFNVDNYNNFSGKDYISYLFASLPGVSKVGSYIGTGTDQVIDCAFTNGARFVLIKRTDSAGDWYLWDSARGITAGNDPYVLLNRVSVEVATTDYIDPDNSWFTITSNAPAALNAVDGEYIFLAFD